MSRSPSSGSGRFRWEVAALAFTIVGTLAGVGSFALDAMSASDGKPDPVPTESPLQSSVPEPHGGGPAATITAPLADGNSPEVRRSTSQPIGLNVWHQADLDSLDGDWGVQSVPGPRGGDISNSPNSEVISSRGGAEIAPVKGPLAYETCENATAYTSEVDLAEVDPGATYCVRTSGKRFAYITLVGLDQPVMLDVTVWDPPFN